MAHEPGPSSAGPGVNAPRGAVAAGRTDRDAAGIIDTPAPKDPWRPSAHRARASSGDDPSPGVPPAVLCAIELSDDLAGPTEHIGVEQWRTALRDRARHRVEIEGRAVVYGRLRCVRPEDGARAALILAAGGPGDAGVAGAVDRVLTSAGRQRLARHPSAPDRVVIDLGGLVTCDQPLVRVIGAVRVRLLMTGARVEVIDPPEAVAAAIDTATRWPQQHRHPSPGPGRHRR